jgi:1-acyl-sn-glycerol-3-phosphate acyltransferase
MSGGSQVHRAADPSGQLAHRNDATLSKPERLDVEASPRPSRRSTPPSPHRRVHQALRFLMRPAFRASFGMDSSGLEHIPPCGPYILAYNHVSMLDWAFVSYFLPEPVRFVVDRDYFDQPLLRIPMRINGAIPAFTDRPDPVAIRRAESVLRAGEPLVLTPEGCISRTGRPGNGQPGIIALAASARVPILPAAIRGAFEVFPRHRRLPRPGRVSVVFGPLLPPPTAADRATQRALVGRLMRYITALLDDAPGAERPW